MVPSFIPGPRKKGERGRVMIEQCLEKLNVYLIQPIHSFLPNRNESIFQHTALIKNVHRCFICNGQKWETEMSVNVWTAKQIVLYPYCGLLVTKEMMYSHTWQNGWISIPNERTHKIRVTQPPSLSSSPSRFLR